MPVAQPPGICGKPSGLAPIPGAVEVPTVVACATSGFPCGLWSFPETTNFRILTALELASVGLRTRAGLHYLCPLLQVLPATKGIFPRLQLVISHQPASARPPRVCPWYGRELGLVIPKEHEAGLRSWEVSPAEFNIEASWAIASADAGSLVLPSPGSALVRIL